MVHEPNLNPSHTMSLQHVPAPILLWDDFDIIKKKLNKKKTERPKNCRDGFVNIHFFFLIFCTNNVQNDPIKTCA